jgi:solute carrier family 25 (adenine nucleotide translocator) protein 4/5/6/31
MAIAVEASKKKDIKAIMSEFLPVCGSR